MGNLCQNPNQTSNVGIIDNDKTIQSLSKIRVDQSEKTINLPFIEEDLHLSTKSEGFTCDGGLILKSDCKLGENNFLASQTLQAYFSKVNDIVFCQDCAKAALDPINLKDQWWGYSKRPNKAIINYNLKALVIIRNYIGGYGTDFLITGQIDSQNSLVKLKINQRGNYQYLNGKISEQRSTISGNFLDGEYDETREFKLCKITHIKHTKPFAKTEIPSGDLNLITHRCALKGPIESEDGWGPCITRSIFGTKCIDGICNFYQTRGVDRYRCETCDYDFCIECIRFSVWAENILNQSTQTWTGFYVYDGNKSEMTFEKLVIASGVILGKGTDEVGDFYINGYQKGLKIKYIKKYHGKHSVLYKGTIENGNVVRGQWKLDDMTDDFELHLQV
eukprot:403370740